MRIANFVGIEQTNTKKKEMDWLFPHCHAYVDSHILEHLVSIIQISNIIAYYDIRYIYIMRMQSSLDEADLYDTPAGKKNVCTVRAQHIAIFILSY